MFNTTTFQEKKNKKDFGPVKVPRDLSIFLPKGHQDSKESLKCYSWGQTYNQLLFLGYQLYQWS